MNRQQYLDAKERAWAEMARMIAEMWRAGREGDAAAAQAIVDEVRGCKSLTAARMAEAEIRTIFLFE